MAPKAAKIAAVVTGAEPAPEVPAEVTEQPAAEAPKAGPVIDYMCGLRKIGPRKYSVVYGRCVDGVPSFTVEEAAQPLEFAAVELREVLHKVVGIIP